MTSTLTGLARAIAHGLGDDFDSLPRDKRERQLRMRRDGDFPDATQADMIEAAAAALRYLREPSKGMLEAAADEIVVGCCSLGQPEAQACWQTMIDHILAEKVDG